MCFTELIHTDLAPEQCKLATMLETQIQVCALSSDIFPTCLRWVPSSHWLYSRRLLGRVCHNLVFMPFVHMLSRMLSLVLSGIPFLSSAVNFATSIPRRIVRARSTWHYTRSRSLTMANISSEYALLIITTAKTESASMKVTERTPPLPWLHCRDPYRHLSERYVLTRSLTWP